MSPVFRFDKPAYPPTRDYMRLAVMVVMLLVILAMFFALQSQIRPPQQSGVQVTPADEPQDPTPSPPTTPPAAAESKENEKELLAQVRDDAPIEIKPYYYLLGKIFTMSQAEIDRKVAPNLIPFDCLADPVKHRGEFLRFEGSLWRLHEVKMSPASGFDYVYEGTIARQGPPGGPFVFCTVILTQKPAPALKPKECDVVFTGVFLKTIVYENRGEPDEMGRRNLTKSPLFIGKQIVLAKRRPGIGKRESMIFLAIGIVALGVFAYVVLFQGRRTPAHERHFALPSNDESDASPEDEKTEGSESASPDDKPHEEPPSPQDDSSTDDEEGN